MSAEALALAVQLGEQHKRENRLLFYDPYPWQREFHNAGKDNPSRLLMCANGVGKTYPGSYEVVVHMTGLYPDWWKGRRFDHPIDAWCGSISNQTQRDYTQPALLGTDLGENLGTGWAPKDRIVGKIKTRAAGVPDVADGFSLRHVSGGVSHASMKTYEQGWRMWQGAAPHIVWCDEQPDENATQEKRIPSEIQTRIFRSQGMEFWTLTPLLGETDLIRKFLNPKVKGIIWVGATWDDAPHLDDSAKELAIASYPDHEVEVRTKGVPMMGEGRIFSVSEDDIKCDPFDIPNHFARIVGLDFGMDHPTAAAWIAWDRDSNTFYVYKVYRRKGETPVYHAAAINEQGNWIPVSWPHDGMNRDTGSGRELHSQYRTAGVNMLPKSARYPKQPGEDTEKGGKQPQWPVIMDILQLMKLGQFKVFSTCHEFFDEYRSYHQKDGTPVPIRDDVLKATFYGMMMKRYAVPRFIQKSRPVNTRPIAV